MALDRRALIGSGLALGAASAAPARSSPSPFQHGVASGDSRQLTGMVGFRPCVRLDDALPGADCHPRATGTH